MDLFNIYQAMLEAVQTIIPDLCPTDNSNPPWALQHNFIMRGIDTQRHS